MTTDFDTDSYRLKISLVIFTILIVVLSSIGSANESISNIHKGSIIIPLTGFYLIMSALLLIKDLDLMNVPILVFVALAILAFLILGFVQFIKIASASTSACSNCLSYRIFGSFALLSILFRLALLAWKTAAGEPALRSYHFRLLAFASFVLSSLSIIVSILPDNFDDYEKLFALIFACIAIVLLLFGWVSNFYSKTGKYDKYFFQTAFISILSTLAFCTSIYRYRGTWMGDGNIGNIIEVYTTNILYLCAVATVTYYIANDKINFNTSLQWKNVDLTSWSILIFLILSFLAFLGKNALHQIDSTRRALEPMSNPPPSTPSTPLSPEARATYNIQTYKIALDSFLLYAICSLIMLLFISLYQNPSFKETRILILILILSFSAEIANFVIRRDESVESVAYSIYVACRYILLFMFISSLFISDIFDTVRSNKTLVSKVIVASTASLAVFLIPRVMKENFDPVLFSAIILALVILSVAFIFAPPWMIPPLFALICFSLCPLFVYRYFDKRRETDRSLNLGFGVGFGVLCGLYVLFWATRKIYRYLAARYGQKKAILYIARLIALVLLICGIGFLTAYYLVMRSSNAGGNTEPTTGDTTAGGNDEREIYRNLAIALMSPASLMIMQFIYGLAQGIGSFSAISRGVTENEGSGSMPNISQPDGGSSPTRGRRALPIDPRMDAYLDAARSTR